MIRLVLLLVLLAALAFAGAWLADRPGEITVVWQGWSIQTTVPVALAALAVITAVMMLIWRAISLLLRSPRLWSAFSARRRREKGWSAVTRGLLAIGTGDAASARHARAEAARYLPNEPLTHLLAAQTAQFDGNRELAVAHFRAMADKAHTKLLGLRGLHMEARRAGDHHSAAAFAEEAAKSAPTLAWAAEAVIEARCADGDFAGARAVLERQMAQKGIDKAQYRRRRAVLLAAEAIAMEHNDPLVARERAVEAVRLAPTLVPAAACAGRLLGAAGEFRKAAKIVETAFAANPHPELAEVEAHLRPGDAAQDRLKRIRALAAKASGNRESAIALARAAIDAHEFNQARLVLEPLLDEPSQRVCLLMAELEAAEHSDIGKAREWTARAVRANRDPAWIADGVVSDHWAPISPVSGKLDAFVWAVPPGVSSTPILEHEAERVKAAIAAVRASEEAKAAALAAEAAQLEAAQVEAAHLEAAPVDVTPVEPARIEEARPSAVVLAPVPAAADPEASHGASPASPKAPPATPTASAGSRPATVLAPAAEAEPAASDEGGSPAAAAEPLPAPGAGRLPAGGTGEAGPSQAATSQAAEASATEPSAATSRAATSPVERREAGALEAGLAAGVAEDRVVRLPSASSSAPTAMASSAAQAMAAPALMSQASAARVEPAPTAAPRPTLVSAPSAANDPQRPSRVEPIVALPPLPDDPGPGPEEPEEPEPPGRRPRYLEF